MHRCVLRPADRRRPTFRSSTRLQALAALLPLLLAAPLPLLAPATAQAQSTSSVVQVAPATRRFPADALRGDISFGTPPAINLNGRSAQLAPGVRVHGADNMLVLTGALAGNKATCNYRLEPTTGLVIEVWILTTDERTRLPWPQTTADLATWRFDAAAQVWIKP